MFKTHYAFTAFVNDWKIVITTPVSFSDLLQISADFLVIITFGLVNTLMNHLPCIIHYTSCFDVVFL